MSRFLESVKNCNKLNYNLDCDGICSFLLMKRAFQQLGFGGFTNSDRIILSTNMDSWMDDKTLFIDIFLKSDDVWCIDQHIYLNRNEEDLYQKKVNPHNEIENRCACDVSYYRKYPFASAHFILANLEREGLMNYNLPFDDVIDVISRDGVEITFGDLFLNLDGVLGNYLKYEKNVREWAERLIAHSNGGSNVSRMFEYLFSRKPSDFADKDKTIRGFYEHYGLEDDGGFNSSIPMEDNVRLIENLKRSFNKYICADIESNCVKLYEYVGDRKVTYVNENYVLDDCDTFAYVGKEKLSYTKEIKPTNREFTFNLYI